MTVATETVRVNLGSGPLPLEGWLNVDQTHPTADLHGDVRDLQFDGVAEVNCSHLLEHLPFVDVIPTLARIRSWMTEGGTITVEVPDMRAINARMDPSDMLWVVYAYGCQEHEGEFHRCGFTADSLAGALDAAGWRVDSVREFDSDNRNRPGMPCVEARATA